MHYDRGNNHIACDKVNILYSGVIVEVAVRTWIIGDDMFAIFRNKSNGGIVKGNPIIT